MTKAQRGRAILISLLRVLLGGCSAEVILIVVTKIAATVCEKGITIMTQIWNLRFVE